MAGNVPSTSTPMLAHENVFEGLTWEARAYRGMG